MKWSTNFKVFGLLFWVAGVFFLVKGIFFLPLIEWCNPLLYKLIAFLSGFVFVFIGAALSERK